MDLHEAIETIPLKDWSEIEKFSRRISTRFSKMGWWNNKYYKRNPQNDGSVEQIDEKGRREIPYDRKLFWPSTGRFSLDSEPVAYFSNDFALNCCEAIEQYREKELSWEELNIYLNGYYDPTPELYGYPISIRLTPTASIFDLNNESFSFFDALAKVAHYPSKEAVLKNGILSKDQRAYPLTQGISMAVRDRGFDGLSYKSVRAPIGISLPSRNLVIFNPAIVLRDRW